MKPNYNRFLTFEENCIKIFIRHSYVEGQGDGKVKTKVINLANFETLQDALVEARKIRDEMYLELRGQPFNPLTQIHSYAGKKSKTKLVGVTPYTNVNVGVQAVSFAFGFTASYYQDGKRVRKMIPFKRNDEESKRSAMWEAVQLVREHRGLEPMDEVEFAEVWDQFDYDFEQAVADKLEQKATQGKKMPTN